MLIIILKFIKLNYFIKLLFINWVHSVASVAVFNVCSYLFDV